jgi:hypothetical protein
MKSAYGYVRHAVLLFALSLMTVIGCGAAPDGADTTGATSATSATSEDTASASEALLTCGGAGQPCCIGGGCNKGYACNANGICRTPCGAYGERCCGGVGGTCGYFLACYPDGTCGLR